jgi:hypothetical protein
MRTYILRCVIFFSAILVSWPLFAQTAADGPDKEDRAISQMLKAAEKQERAWEWSGEVPEVKKVAAYGKKIAPKLVRLLDHPGTWTFDEHIIADQQVQLVLCRLFDERPGLIRTVYAVRALPVENQKVRLFWEQRANKFVEEGK